MQTNEGVLEVDQRVCVVITLLLLFLLNAVVTASFSSTDRNELKSDGNFSAPTVDFDRKVALWVVVGIGRVR